MYFYSFINHTQQQADFERFLTPGFVSKIEPSSGHCTRIEKHKTQKVMDGELPLQIRNTL
jgi:hypothetical protein